MKHTLTWSDITKRSKHAVKIKSRDTPTYISTCIEISDDFLC